MFGDARSAQTRWPADAAQSQLWNEAVREAVQANKTGEASLQKRRREVRLLQRLAPPRFFCRLTTALHVLLRD